MTYRLMLQTSKACTGRCATVGSSERQRNAQQNVECKQLRHSCSAATAKQHTANIMQ